MAVGLLLGIVALSAVIVLMFRAGRKLPIKRFLSIAATIIMVLSVAFLGNAVLSLQNIGVIGSTSDRVVPRLPYLLAELTGIHPALEPLLAQLALTLIYVGGAVAMLRRPAPRAVSEPARRPASAWASDGRRRVERICPWGACCEVTVVDAVRLSEKLGRSVSTGRPRSWRTQRRVCVIGEGPG